MSKPHTVFDRETLLDALVNVVPLGILLFFTVLFVVSDPWSQGISFVRALQHSLIAVPFVGLALLTYWTAKHV